MRIGVNATFAVDLSIGVFRHRWTLHLMSHDRGFSTEDGEPRYVLPGALHVLRCLATSFYFSFGAVMGDEFGL